MKAPTRRLTGITERAIERAIAGGNHRVDIDEHGRVTILPLSVDPAQVGDAALDAEIRETFGDGHAGH